LFHDTLRRSEPTRHKLRSFTPLCGHLRIDSLNRLIHLASRISHRFQRAPRSPDRRRVNRNGDEHQHHCHQDRFHLRDSPDSPLRPKRHQGARLLMLLFAAVPFAWMLFLIPVSLSLMILVNNNATTRIIMTVTKIFLIGISSLRNDFEFSKISVQFND
jgi:hypothetical protein